MEQIPTEVMVKIEEKLCTILYNQYGNTFAVPEIMEYLKQTLASPCALCEGKEKEIAELKSKCDSDHVSIDDLLSEFDRRGFKTDNWDGDTFAHEAIVSGVKNHIDELTHYQSQRISELEAEKERLNKKIEHLIADKNTLLDAIEDYSKSQQ